MIRWLFVCALFWSFGAAADPAQFGSGSTSVGQTGSISEGTDQELIDAFKQGLKNAGMDDKTIDALDGQIRREVGKLKEGKARADTYSFFSGVAGGIKKWSITLLPGKSSDADTQKNTEVHEEGHRKIDQAAVDAVNAAAASGKIAKDAGGQKITDLLVAYENGANAKYHDLFGTSPATTKKKIEDAKTDAKSLQEKSVAEGKDAGQKALDEALKK